MNNDVIKMAAVGDICLGDHYFNFGFGVGSVIDRNGPGFVFEHVVDTLSQYDIVFGNLETPLSSHNLNSKRLSSCQMRGTPQSVLGLKRANFTMLSLANNHIMQHGSKAMIDTCDLLSRSGINYCGVEEVVGVSPSKCSLEIKGVRFCFLAYNDHFQQFFVDDPIYKKFSLDKAISEIDLHRKNADVIVISLHWGDEYMELPSNHQQNIAHVLIDHGADLILGHHSHVIQTIERYKNSLIFYSLGDFVFVEEGQSLIASLEYDTQNRNFNYYVIPIKTNKSFQPVILLDKEKRDSLVYLNAINEEFLEWNRRGAKVYEQLYQKRLKEIASRRCKLRHIYWLKNVHRFSIIVLLQYVYDYTLRRCKRIFLKR